mmetsp:Transcript_5635/g.10191  ORF Transcript_5635/g.10191 Transcript_5635/m.10191 type:complete len:209 (-) Transcript_5635:48-674(-)
MRDRLFHQRQRLVLRHIFPKFRIDQSVNKRRSAPTNRKWQRNARPSQRNAIHRPATHGIPPPHNDAGHEIVLIFVTQSTHQMRCHLHLRRTSGLDGELRQVMADVIRQCLGVGGGARAAAPNVIVQLGDFVGSAVSDIGAGGYAGVGAKDDASIELHRHDGCTRRDLAGFEMACLGRLASVSVSFRHRLARHWLGEHHLGMVIAHVLA